jgi:pyridinium-3,5-bisthiocarboxylic acid mononucleotide nickel chelatase
VKVLVFDPFAGISGDMALGALLDLGMPVARLREVAEGTGIPGIEVVTERVERRGIACWRVEFRAPEQKQHRHLPDVLKILARAPVPEAARQRAAEAFQLLAEAEAGVHGVPVERVHFHEVGAIDSILDILGFMTGVTELGFERFHTRPVMAGSGWIEIAHGRYPVPAPATLKLLQRFTLQEPPLPGECTTPTGAALLAALVEEAPPPPLQVLASGYGAGGRDPATHPNCLRLVACEAAPTGGGERMYMVQADLDDLAPEYAATAHQALYDAGAADAVVHPVGMKKGRPGLRLEALVAPGRLEAVLSALFRCSSTIGARYWAVERAALGRSEETVTWRGQAIRQKVVQLPGGEVRRKPEFEDIVAAARALGLTPHEARLALEAEYPARAADVTQGNTHKGGAG